MKNQLEEIGALRSAKTKTPPRRRTGQKRPKKRQKRQQSGEKGALEKEQQTMKKNLVNKYIKKP